MKTLATSLLLATGSVCAQQTPWGQCGGSSWSGATSCQSGSACTSLNPWFYQCVPGATATGEGPSSAAPSSAGATSVVASVPTTAAQSPTTTPKTGAVTTSAAATSAAATSAAATTSAGSSPSPGSGGFAKTNGLLFDIDGVTTYYAGTNCYWCGFLKEDGDVDHVFKNMASAGLKIVRVWGFSDVNTVPTDGKVWFQLLTASGSKINTGADGLQRLDYVVKAAEANGLKLIINFVNYWGDYGGMQAYVNAFGGSMTTWFTDAASQKQYQAYVEAVVSRYKSSSAVFAWELANEPRCPSCDASVVYDWAASTSKYIKSLDPNHLVTLGDEGFGPTGSDDGSYPYQTGAGGYTFSKNLDIPTLDFGTLHLYPDSWGKSMSWGSDWATEHAAMCAKAGKPCLFEEYGGNNSCANENPWQKAAVDTKGMAGDLFWQYGDVLPSCKCETAQDGNTVFYGGSNWDCMVTDHIKYIKSKYN